SSGLPSRSEVKMMKVPLDEIEASPSLSPLVTNLNEPSTALAIAMPLSLLAVAAVVKTICCPSADQLSPPSTAPPLVSCRVSPVVAEAIQISFAPLRLEIKATCLPSGEMAGAKMKYDSLEGTSTRRPSPVDPITSIPLLEAKAIFVASLLREGLISSIESKVRRLMAASSGRRVRQAELIWAVNNS